MKNVLIVALFPLILSACGKSGGEQYVGHWTRVSGHGPDLTVEKHDDVYVVQQSSPLTTQSSQLAADMVGDRLVMHAGTSEVPMVIDKSTGHMLLPGEELERGGK